MWQEGYAYRETGNYINWYSAKAYVEKLNEQQLGGHFTIGGFQINLKFKAFMKVAHSFLSRGKTFILHIDPIFEFGYGSCFWTRCTRLSAALGFEFDAGDTHWYPQSSMSGTVRAVRLKQRSINFNKKPGK